MEQEVADTVEDLVFKLAAKHLYLVLYLAHHVTVAQRLHSLVLLYLPLKKP